MKHRAIGLVHLAVCAALMTAGCGSAPPRDPAADGKAIAAVSAKFTAAENAGSIEQMRACFADDLVVMGPSTKPSVTGIESVITATVALHEAFAVHVEYASEEIAAHGDWGFDRGTFSYTLTPKAGGAAIPGSGKYFWLYRRHADGSWKQARVIWNSPIDPRLSGGG